MIASLPLARQHPPIMRTKHPVTTMSLGIVCSDSKVMPLYWFPKGLRMGATDYLKVMEEVMKPWLNENYPGGNYVWQQDDPWTHTAIKTQKWCTDNLTNFWIKEIWPSSFLYLNPLDYNIWIVVELKACAQPHANIADLKASTDVRRIHQEHLQCIWKRLEAVIAAEGGYGKIQ